MTAVLAVVCGLAGLVAGGVADAFVHKVPREMQAEGAAPGCAGCGRLPQPGDWWRPRCPSCHRPVALRSVLVRLTVAGLFVGAALRFHGSLAVVAYCIGFAGLVTLAVIDLDTKLLPKRIVWPVTGAVFAAFVVTAAVHHQWDDLQRAVLGAFVSSAVLFLIAFIFPAGMGFGDVRLEVLIGLLLGWVSRGTVLAGFVLAFATGGLLSIVLLATGVKGRKDAIPFGPWLALGCVLALMIPATGRYVERHEIRPTVDLVHNR
jgi:leader peptidase (prepilin peptidase)/N-methyltransferase